MTVTVFTTGPGCHMCNVTKLHLRRRGLEFEEVRLDQKPELAEKVRELGFTTAPVVLVDEDDVWDGYSSDRLDALAAELSESAIDAA